MRTFFCLAASAMLAMPGLPALAQSQFFGAEDQYQQQCVKMYHATITGQRSAETVVGSDALKRLAAETEGTGLYPVRDIIGDAQQLAVSGITHMPSAEAFICQFAHTKGASVWILAYSPLTHMVEDYQVQFLAQEDVTRSSDSSDAPVPETTGESGTRRPAAGETPEKPTESEACEMFPDLC